MKPAHAAREDRSPVKVTCLQLRGGFITTIVENDWRAYTVAAIAINCRDVWTIDAVMLESLIKRLNAHRSYALRHQLADGIVNHCRNDARSEERRVGQYGHCTLA